MGRGLSLTAHGVFLFAGVLLICGAVVVSVLAFRAAHAERPDPNEAVAAETAERANAAAAALNDQLVQIGGVLDELARKGAAKVGGGEAMRDAYKVFDKTDGLEQLAAYRPDGRTIWVSRPADRGRIRFPANKHFIAEHLARADGRLRLAAPFKPSKRDGWWSPVTLLVGGGSRDSTAVIVAFVRTEVLQSRLVKAGDVAALFTDAGVLAAAEPQENAPIGASFASAPGFMEIVGKEAQGAYLGEPGLGPSTPRMVGYSKLACCGGVVTTIAPLDPPPPTDHRPIGRWLALLAAGLMIFMGCAIVSRRIFVAPPDPWREFGVKTNQPLA